MSFQGTLGKDQERALKAMYDWWTKEDSQYFVLSGVAGCVDGDTEYFNGTEWKPISQYNILSGEKVMQYDFVNNKPIIDIPLAFINIQIKDEPMFNFYDESDNLVMCLSKEHNVIHQNAVGENIRTTVQALINTLQKQIKIPFYNQDSQLIEFRKVELKSSSNNYSNKYCFNVKTSTLILRKNGNIFITGNSGKSTIVSLLIQQIQGVLRKSVGSYVDLEYLAEVTGVKSTFNPVFVTPTGKAARVLISKGIEATTIHHFLYRPEKVYEEGKKKPKIEFVLKTREFFNRVDIIFVDEASMVTEDIFIDLLSLGKPIVFIGDIAQLPPVEKDNPERNFNIMAKPDVVMNEIHRQAEDSPIIHIATLARLGKPIPWGNFGPGVSVQPTRNVRLSKMLTSDGPTKNVQTLVGFNNTRIDFNNLSRQILGYSEKSDLPIKGDRLVCLKNNYDTGLINGLTGECLRAVNHKDKYQSILRFKADDDDVEFEGDISLRHFRPQMFAEMAINGELENFDEHELQQFTYSYAMTVHKCQGSQFDKVFILDQPFGGAGSEIYNKFMYTAITRAVEKCYILRGSIKSLKLD